MLTMAFTLRAVTFINFCLISIEYSNSLEVLLSLHKAVRFFVLAIIYTISDPDLDEMEKKAIEKCRKSEHSLVLRRSPV